MLLAVTRGSRAGHHIRCCRLDDHVLSAHRDGDHVQVGLGALLLLHVRLPRLVVLAERLAERVSVRNDAKIRSVIVTVACGGFKLVQIVRDLGLSAGESSRDS